MLLVFHRFTLHFTLLLFGRHSRLPFDIVFNMDHHSPVHSYNDYIHQWKAAMEDAYAIASRRSCAGGARKKSYYDLKANSVDLQPKDHVLVHERGGPSKLRSNWEKDVHRVIQHKDKISPVYEVQYENGTGPVRVLHRNLLLQCNDLPLEADATPQQTVPACRNCNRDPCRTRSTTRLSNCPTDVSMSDSDSEDDFFVVSNTNSVPGVLSDSVVDENRENAKTGDSLVNANRNAKPCRARN